MISRRNIRIKVMQVLFALEHNQSTENDKKETTGSQPLISKETALQIQNGKKLFNQKVKESSVLFHLLLAYICEVSKYVSVDAERRSAKFLATVADKNVNTKLANNLIITKLSENEAFQQHLKDEQTKKYISEDAVKRLYKKLIESEVYQDYIKSEDHEPEADKNIIRFIWKEIMLEDEKLIADFADEWDNWEDDEDLMKMLVGNFLTKMRSYNFKNFISEEKKEYAEHLLSTVIEKQAFLLDIIRKKLKNWEAERIAQIDLVLLKMGLSEFLYFPTIPATVTINEYIDIAKNYSTDQSGQFVNGVLDNLRKDLIKENKLRKIERIK